jgi:transposase
MLAITAQMRIFVAIEAVDFRRGIDGLAAVCREELGEDPFSGAVFVFRSQSRKAIKLLTYDGQGYWLAMKRLSQGRLHWWPTSQSPDVRKRLLAAQELQVLLWNGNPATKGMTEAWRRVVPRGLSGENEKK